MTAPPRPTHTEWQAQLVDLAQAYGWRHLHVRRSIGKGKTWVTATNVKGWPDLLLWHPDCGGVLAVEVKVPPDEPTPEQSDVLDELAAAGVPSYVWYPDDLDFAADVLRTARKGRS